MTCGSNVTQTRNVECFHMVTEELSDLCLDENKPETSRPCQNLKACQSKSISSEKTNRFKCKNDELKSIICMRYIKLCDNNSRFRKKCCKTCQKSIKRKYIL